MQLLQESVLYLNQFTEEPEVHSFAGGQAAIFTAPCPNRSTANEDAAAVIQVADGVGVLAVADGLGGNAVGERASAIALEQIVSAVTEMDGADGMLRTAIINGIERANIAIRDLGLGAATTLAIAEVSHGTVRSYHVGDSAILLAGGRGKVKFQSVMHSPVGYGVESGLLDEAEALLHGDRHLVSNVVGSAEMRIEIGPTLPLSARDTLVLASDGLVDNLTATEIISTIKSGPLPAALRRLASAAMDRMANANLDQPYKPDDLTIVVYRPSAAAKEI